MNHMRKDKFRDYFGEALDLVEQFAIEPVVSFHLDYDPELICQFFASVYFHPGDERRMTWMTNGHKLTATWKEFMDLLQVPDDGLDTPVGVPPMPILSLRTRTSFSRSMLRRCLPIASRHGCLTLLWISCITSSTTLCSLALVTRTRFMPIWWI